MNEWQYIIFIKRRDFECKQFLLFQINQHERQTKVTIVEQLKRFGITKEFLFADDVDIVLKGIIDDQRKRYPES